MTVAGTPGQPIRVQIPTGYGARSSAVNTPVGYWSFTNGAQAGFVVLNAQQEISFMVGATTTLLTTTAAVGNIMRFNISFPAI